MIKEWICNWLCDYDRRIPKPDIVGRIEYQELYSRLKAEFGVDVAIMLSDNHYELATMESFKRFLEADRTDKYKYIGDPGGFDCNNYVEILSGNSSIPKWASIPIGSCWLSKPAHAVNVFVDENKDIYLVEPQNDYIFRLSDMDDWRVHIVWI